MKIGARSAKTLDTIPSTPSYDRAYINQAFSIFLSEEYIIKKIKKCIKKGIDPKKLRAEVLKKLRESERHQIMKGKSASINYKIISFLIAFFWQNMAGVQKTPKSIILKNSYLNKNQ